MLTLTEAEYLDRVHGGWLGKLIGGAVGQPLDGQKQTHEVTGYPEALRRSPAAGHEGTDLQLVWLRAVQSAGPKVTTGDLIGGWLRHIAHAHGEYPHATANFRLDLPPPLSGVFDNPFRESLGALARAEMWGMLTPGDPEQAAWFARRDAMIDHSGAGLDAAIWLAVLASAACAESDLTRLLDLALGLVPGDGRVARAVKDVLRWHAELVNWSRTREMLLRSYGTDDVRDSAVAVGMIALALLDGRGDFGRSVLTAASCGWSTACTCAAVGAVLGLVQGAARLPSDWRAGAPSEVAAGPSLVGLPRLIPCSGLAEQTCEMGRLVIRSECAGRVQLAPEPPEEDPKLPRPDSAALLRQLAIGPYVVSHRRGPLRIQVDYDGRPAIGYDSPRRLTIALASVSTRTLEVQVRLSAPAGFVVTMPSESITLAEGTTVSFVLTCTAPREHARIAPANPFTLLVSADDGSEFTVPITLAGEALWFAAGPYGGFDEAHAPEQPAVLAGETSLGPDGWRRLSVPEPTVGLLGGLEGDPGTYYLATDISAPAVLRARLRVACNDGVVAWLNGREVLRRHDHRAASPLSADEPEVELEEGWNRLVIKMAQCTSRRYLSVALRDPQGQILVEAASTSPRSG